MLVLDGLITLTRVGTAGHLHIDKESWHCIFVSYGVTGSMKGDVLQDLLVCETTWFEPIPSPVHIKHPLNETMFSREFPHSIGTIINECYHNMQLGCEKNRVMGFFTLYYIIFS